MRAPVRVLRIEAGRDTDADGRSFGEDWLLADLGRGTDSARYYLTTDGVRGSELADDPTLSPAALAQFVADALNARTR